MCGPGADSTMTIGSDGTTVDPKTGKPVTPKGATADQIAQNYGLGSDPTVPSAIPSLTDDSVKAARSAKMLRLLSGQGRASTFLSGPLGDTSTPQLGKPTLTGGS